MAHGAQNTCVDLSDLEGLPVASYHGDHGQHEGLAGVVAIARGLLLQNMLQLADDVAGHVAQVIHVRRLYHLMATWQERERERIS